MEFAKYALFLLTSALAFAGAWLFSFTETDSATGRRRLTRPGKIALPVAIALLIASFVFAFVDDRQKAEQARETKKQAEAREESAKKQAEAREESLNRQLSGLRTETDKLRELIVLTSQPQSRDRDAKIAALIRDRSLQTAAQSDSAFEAALTRLENALGGRQGRLKGLASSGVALPSNLDDVLLVASVGLQMFGRAQPDASGAVVRMLRGLDADIVTVEEIVNRRAFEQVVAQVPRYRFVYGGFDSVMTQAVLFREDRVTLVGSTELLDGSPEPFQRRPLAMRFLARGKQFNLLAVHLKSPIGGLPSTEQRQRQAAAISEWVRKLPQNDPIVVVGRLHALPEDPELAPLAEAGLAFASKELPPNSSTFISNHWGPIIHSNVGFGGEMTKRYIAGSVLIHNLVRLTNLSLSDVTKNISDNNPISAAFRLD